MQKQVTVCPESLRQTMGAPRRASHTTRRPARTGRHIAENYRQVLCQNSSSALVFACVMTMRFNVPRNEALRRVATSSAEAASLWADYLGTWTSWNHVRTAAAFLASACFGLGMNA